ncbi:hypothetical protein AMAG_06866 [Allomyces macrogynus ATCC 38327]|uniref:E3 ubiquitin-protein ligase n=1 Tax=Allomyces macrogynus (strain ATCC 38327) TaxID=578462 RepID=A0A0L0SFA0_ALLM3|nr:hypothetical protein AMAG_06866 [Allomyces macrogynus ATCC 38327]|eukprot:KNE61114.1 hypothetical protein AMAG_06866 [Allomyces macrogynus ATCC 38327]
MDLMDVVPPAPAAPSAAYTKTREHLANPPLEPTPALSSAALSSALATSTGYGPEITVPELFENLTTTVLPGFTLPAAPPEGTTSRIPAAAGGPPPEHPAATASAAAIVMALAIATPAPELQEETPREAVACGRVFRKGDIIYRCATCALDSTCVLCGPCFNAQEHVGHTTFVYTSLGGGCCDCGVRCAAADGGGDVVGMECRLTKAVRTWKHRIARRGSCRSSAASTAKFPCRETVSSCR